MALTRQTFVGKVMSLFFNMLSRLAISFIPRRKKEKKGEKKRRKEKRREAKGKGEKERYTHLTAEFQRIARRDKKDFLSDQCK